LKIPPDPYRDRRVASRLGLDVDRHPLAAPVRLEDDLILVAHAGVLQQGRLDLTRIEIDPLVDHHVVGAPAKPIEPQRRPPAVAARARHDAREVVRPVADQREPLPGQRRDDQLALGAVRHDAPRRGVDHLGVIVVLPDVNAAAGHAVDAEPGSTGLGHADDVEGADAQLALDPRPQLVGPHLGAEDADPERERREVEGLLARGLDQAQGIGRDRGEHGRLEIAHETQLQRGAPRAGRDHHRADPLGAVVEAESAGEEAERRRDLDDVVRADTRRDVAAGHHLAPLRHVCGGVRIQDRISGRPARHLDPPVVAGARAREPVGVRVAELVLREEGQRAPGLDTSDVFRAGAAEAPRPRRLGQHVRERGAHPLDDEPFERLPVEGLELRLPHGLGAHGHRV